MKDLAINHISIKQSILSDLVNAKELEQDSRVKVSLLNNAFVFPVPLSFDVEEFAKQLLSFVNDQLNASAKPVKYGDDIYSVEFSPIGLGLMKKAAVFCLLDSHVYINIVPVKEIENPNYTEGRISELLSSGKTGKIYEFTENYILGLYPEAISATTKPQGRYFYSTDIGVAPILASHLEDGELILAKLDIYRIDSSRSNAQTTEMDSAFYLSTTNGSYLFVLDKNLQEKYIETLSAETMTVKAQIGRDPVSCGSTKWLSNRDNDFLFDEVSRANNLGAQDKLLTFSQLHFNLGDTQGDREYASRLIEVYAQNENTHFARFAAKFVEFCVSMGGESAVINKILAIQLMECANSMFSEDNFENKVCQFISGYKFTATELASLIFVVSRAHYRVDDTEKFASMFVELKNKYFNVDADSLNRSFVCVSVAKKLNMLGERKSAAKFADEALSLCGDMSTTMLAPGLDTTPDQPYSGASLRYAALEELYKAAQTDKERYKFALEMAVLKPLIEGNLSNAIKYSPDDSVKARLQAAMSVFDVERYNNFSYTTTSSLEGRFSKISQSSYMPRCTERRMAYSGFENWLAKVTPDKSISSVKSYGELVDTNNFHLLYEFDESLSKYFDLDVDVFVIPRRNQGVISNDDGESRYVIIDAELLDTENTNYMNGSELLFVMAREFASIRLGLSRLTCHPQWRNYSVNGVHSQDVISLFAPEPSFISGQSARYTRLVRFGKLLSVDNYFNFEIDDTTKAADMLEATIKVVQYAGEQPVNIKEIEYSALSQLTAMIADRAGLLVSGNLVTSIKAMIHNDSQIKGGAVFCESDTVAAMACSRGTDDRPLNYDFAMRLNALLSFYISDDYKIK